MLLLSVTCVFFSLSAENGSRLWLRFSSVQSDKTTFSGIIGEDQSLAARELKLGWQEMSGRPLKVQKKISNQSLILLKGHRNDLPLSIVNDIQALSQEGYLIKSVVHKGKKLTILGARTDAGLLYGAYHLLRQMQTGAAFDALENPSYQWRILNHWDNPDGTVERGYAGYSLWKWDELPEKISPRYEAYARANASIGINATVLNNVNASPVMLTAEYLQKVKAIAEVLRPFHIRVFLSINFSSPKAIGGLPDSDPLNSWVQQWWKDKTKEIYGLIPDFGGFLVKANSEGLPGPMDYGRTHVDGANMLADALQPFGGIVMWRAFVYEPGDDRAKLAYKEFHHFDGKFRDNVIIQVKNGPIDFQPREPFSPLFGAMKQTPLMPELQITQEYLGQANHLVFMVPMWREFLEADTYAEGKGTTIDKISSGKIYPQKITALAGVANIGEDANWTGHHFAQANWYAFGRLAWNNQLSSSEIADEWLKMTFSVEANEPLKEMMLDSHEACVSYMMPLGLHHLFAWEHHYGPEPWCEIPGARADWLPKYYHQADSQGVGYNRTCSGSQAVGQYYSPLREEFNDPATCPEKYLLWFHHLPWYFKMKNGRTLWDELSFKYNDGVMQVRNFQQAWQAAQPDMDPQRFEEVKAKLEIQARDAVWWKDACLLYFQNFSGRPLPVGVEPAVHQLDSLKRIKLNMKHHN